MAYMHKVNFCLALFISCISRIEGKMFFKQATAAVLMWKV